MSGLIPEDIISRIRDSADIVELVSRYVSLKKTGANYKGLCPFHKEKTPSFIVSPTRQTFHCFGCGEGGTVFQFLMKIDRVSFPEAVRSLAKQANIEIPETRATGPDQEARRDESARLYEANRRAADFYARQLAGPMGKAARGYIKDRGISDAMVEQCCLGYSGESWDGLINAASAARISPALLVKAGLAIEREGRSGCYDRFRNRLMFPIFDTQERVIGFGARTLGDDEVKYLNSPETAIFSKGRNLYGLNWARKSIVDTGRVIVVEGYTDVIMARQHGCINVVATLGTALTREHIQALRRFAHRVDVVFDSDSAGQHAAERSMELFVNEGAGEFVGAGFDVRIATLGQDKDPCDLIAEHGPAAFTSVVDAAVDVFTQKVNIVSRRYDLSMVDGKTKALDEVLALLALVPNAVARELHTDALVRLLADKFRIDDRALRSRLAQIERRTRRDRGRPAAQTASAPAFGAAERGVLEGILNAPDLAPVLFEELTPDDFESRQLGDLFARARELYEAHGAVNPSHMLAPLEDTEAASFVSGILTSEPRPGLESAALDCRNALLKRRTQNQIREIQNRLRHATDTGDEKLADDLNTQYLKLQREVLPL